MDEDVVKEASELENGDTVTVPMTVVAFDQRRGARLQTATGQVIEMSIQDLERFGIVPVEAEAVAPETKKRTRREAAKAVEAGE